MSAGRRHEASSIALAAVLGTIATLATLLLLAPTVVVVVLSFTDGFSLKFPPPGYSLRWYASLPDAFQLQYAALNSLKVASAATSIAVVLGVAAAMAIARSETQRWPPGHRVGPCATTSVRRLPTRPARGV